MYIDKANIIKIIRDSEHNLQFDKWIFPGKTCITSKLTLRLFTRWQLGLDSQTGHRHMHRSAIHTGRFFYQTT